MKKLLSALCTLALLAGCSSDDTSKKEDQPTTISRTVVVYMSGENSLYRAVPSDIEEMKQGSKNIGNDKALIVYVDNALTSELPWLARIKDGQITDSVSIKDMSISDKDALACNPEVMEDVLKYAFNKYPANEYALTLWGHSFGWVIQDSLPYNRRCYGIDNGTNGTSDEGYWINIPTLGKILSKMPHMKYIFADCCNFQCLETLYELRNVADYIIGSPAEIPGYGAPYHLVVPAMFEATTYYNSIIDKYYDYYLDLYKQYGQHMESVPLSAVKTSEMARVASATGVALKAAQTNISDDYPDMTGMIPYYNNHLNSYLPEYNIFYDAGNFLKTYAPANDYDTWKKVLDSAVVKKRKAVSWQTDKSWFTHYSDFEVTEENYSGVSMFVPQNPYTGYYMSYNAQIKQLSWYFAAALSDIGW